MLYLSTRSKTDSFTAFRAAHNENTPDGGLYVPFRIKPFNAEELTEMKTMTFGESVAKILNLFFSQQLTGWDVDFCIGKASVKIENAGHKAIVAELWHNPEGVYEVTRNALYSRLYSTSELPSEWAKVAIDTAILFGVFTQCCDTDLFDIALCEEEITLITAAWYAKNLGLPIGRILLVCNGESALWDMVRNGKINSTMLKKKGNNISRFVERIIFDCYGFMTTQDYIAAFDKNEPYGIEEEAFAPIADRLQTVVVGADRADKVIQSTERSNGYTLSRDTARALGGLHDYRSQGGDSVLTLLIAEAKPDI